MNIFVKDFEVFKNLLHISEFRAIVLQCEQVCTLFNQVPSSRASRPLELTFTHVGHKQSGQSTSPPAPA